MMMMQAAKLGLAELRGEQEQGWSKARAGLKHEQGRSRAERGKELGKNWGGARNVQDRSMKGAGQEYVRGRVRSWGGAG